MNIMLKVGTVLLGSAAVMAGTIPAAHAACTDSVCAYEGPNGSGTVAGFTTADVNFSNNRFLDGSPVNDRISSASGTRGPGVYFYTDSYFRGQGFRVLANGNPQNMPWDNQASSFRFGL